MCTNYCGCNIASSYQYDSRQSLTRQSFNFVRSSVLKISFFLQSGTNMALHILLIFKEKKITISNENVKILN